MEYRYKILEKVAKELDLIFVKPENLKEAAHKRKRKLRKLAMRWTKEPLPEAFSKKDTMDVIEDFLIETLRKEINSLPEDERPVMISLTEGRKDIPEEDRICFSIVVA